MRAVEPVRCVKGDVRTMLKIIARMEFNESKITAVPTDSLVIAKVLENVGYKVVRGDDDVYLIVEDEDDD